MEDFSRLGEEIFGVTPTHSTEQSSGFVKLPERPANETPKSHYQKYRDYLETPEWKEKRLLVLARDGYRCMVCTAKKFLDVHHKTYDRLFKEPLEDLVTLCRRCHSKFHDNDPEAD